MNLIDVTTWKKIEDKSVDGTRNKYVVLHPQTLEEFIIKLPKLSGVGGDNEIITEWMATALLGKAWGFNVQQCEPCTFEGKLALKMVPLVKTRFSHWISDKFCRLVTIKDQMWEEGLQQEWTPRQHGTHHHFDFVSTMLLKIFLIFFEEEFTKDNPETLSKFNNNIIHEELFFACQEIDPDMIFSNVIVPFHQMLLFDAIIGNTDRHRENYGFLFTETQPPKYCPLFDNATCLFWNKIDVEIETIKSNKGFKKYTKNCLSQITLPSKTKISHFDLIEFILATRSTKKLLLLLWKWFKEQYENETIYSLLAPTSPWFSAKRQAMIAEYIDIRVKQLDELFRFYTDIE
jgi:hypothetical protein